MGFMDKFKKKDDLGDLSDLGDFGFDDKGGDGGFPPLDNDPMQAGTPLHEEVHPTQGSLDMGDSLGVQPLPRDLGPPPAGSPGSLPPPTGMQANQPAGFQQQQPMQQPAPQPVQQPAPQPVYQQQPSYQPGMEDVAKDIEIMHAKLDAIKSSLDTINQRLATLERIANPGQQQKYSW